MKNKNILTAVTAVILIAAIVCGSLFFKTNKKIKAAETVKLSDITNEKVSLVAHRGLSSQAPENTLPALQLAAENGHTVAEFDIRLTKDGVWVLSHDSKINRMTSSSGQIADYTYFDLAGIKITGQTYLSANFYSKITLLFKTFYINVYICMHVFKL